MIFAVQAAIPGYGRFYTLAEFTVPEGVTRIKRIAVTGPAWSECLAIVHSESAVTQPIGTKHFGKGDLLIPWVQ